MGISFPDLLSYTGISQHLRTAPLGYAGVWTGSVHCPSPAEMGSHHQGQPINHFLTSEESHWCDLQILDRKSVV